jgi:hypothetical protein
MRAQRCRWPARYARLRMKSTTRRPLAAVALSTALASCVSNYDFAAARLPNGDYDLAKLEQDLAASGEESLIDATWIPLIWLDVTLFTKNRTWEPAGHTLTAATMAAPLFCIGSASKRMVDPEQKLIEREEHDWALWMLLYRSSEEGITTNYGERIESETRVLLLFGGEDTTYQGAVRAASTPAEPPPSQQPPAHQ